MKTINNICLALLVIFAYSCEDIIEEDISDETVTVNYPKNNEQIESNVANFQWKEVDGADEYRIQVYASNQNILLDSVVSSTNFIYSLAPGSYQWRVRGENFAYETAYSFPEGFTMIETSDLTNQQVQLINPQASFYTNNSLLTFSWATINAASHYNFELINVTAGNTIIHQQYDLQQNTYTLPTGIITNDAQYQWKVQAVNDENETQTLFSSRNFYIDTTPPNPSQNISPLNNASLDINDQINFEWSAPTDTGVITSTINYTIQIASDPAFQNVISNQSTSQPSYDFTFTSNGNYYWRVMATDLAGNQSTYSTAFKIVIE